MVDNHHQHVPWPPVCGGVGPVGQALPYRQNLSFGHVAEEHALMVRACH
jgi:hypothetical protein